MYSQLLLHDFSNDLMLISKKTESCRLSIAATKLGFTEGTSFTGLLSGRIWESHSFHSEV